ncbi:grb2-associated and regulator of mapk protein family member [Holotrichia oblita]|uniref:Grb2-associated and regulator of mapk protein family member n=1 Tax=Holotrichia oblita TaxID=644536 RepID=A0ACB9TPC8_HOLOL|nr:grb2-associated and regulator of mapk protein family member [Holotrichia oblita]
MAATDGQITVAAARWADEGSYLREFVTKHRLPAVVKIIKGQYGGLGVPTLPSPGLQSTALLVSAGKRHKIVAQAVKIKEGRRLVCVGPRLAIPDSYPGYFELLSEEGRAVRCIESVAELARRRPEEGCLVRETIRGVQAKTDPDGAVVPEGARTIPAGEILVPSGEATIPGSKGKYLKCVDTKGDTILLGLEQRGKFSALARKIISVAFIRRKIYLVKECLLLIKTYLHIRRGTYFRITLTKEVQSVTALPLAAPLKLLRTKNDEQLRGMAEFGKLVEKCTRLSTEVADRIQVLDGKLGDSKKQANQQLDMKNGYLLRRSASSDSANHRTKHSHHRKDENRLPVHSKDYEEIDQIYDYVRGFAPLPKNIRSPFSDPSPSLTPSSESNKPEPPPIETIPTKKLQAEKRNRKAASSTIREATPKVYVHAEKIPPGLPKLYVKNGHSQRSRLFRQKSASPMKETPPSPISKSGSPLFNIRYKSLNNIQQAMELDGTLDSSNSGGRASGDSGGGTKQPEKRSRKLSRPRSLNNLVWEIREYPDISMMVKPKKWNRLLP